MNVAVSAALPAAPARRYGRTAALVLIGVGVAAPWFVYPVFVMNVLCMALFASAFNLLLGYTGLLSFGHAAFLGASGYLTGLACKSWGLPTELGMLVGIAASTLLGFVIGALAIRRSGVYFSMITLGLAQVVYFVAVQMPFTGGEDGLQDIPRGRILGLVSLEDPYVLYYFVLAVYLLGFGLIYRTIHSPFGHVLRCTRENESRALSLGYDVDRFKLLAFVISAGLAGVAGATKAIVFQAETLTDVHWQMSGEVVLMTLLGGMGTVLGPTVGALIILTLQNYLSSLGSWTTVITGVVFVATVLSFRRGVVGEILEWMRRKRDGGGSP